MRTSSLASMLSGGVALLVACGGLADQATRSEEESALPDRPTPAEQSEAAAAPEAVASDVGEPSAVALTNDRVYFTTARTMQSGVLNDAGALFAVWKRPGSKPLMLSTDAKSAHYEALALDATHAYVATSDARLFRIPLEGGPEEPIADLPAPAVSIAVNEADIVLATTAGVVERVAKDGTGAIEPVATIAGKPRAVSVDELGAIYVATSVTEGEGGTIVKIAAAGGEPSVLTSSDASPCAMIRHGDHLYFSAARTVVELPVNGGSPRPVAAGAFAACALAVDGSDVFFATGDEGLMRAKAAGGEPTPVAGARRARSKPGAVAVDAAHLYWLDGSGVMRVEKR